MAEIDLTPTEEMAANAARGLDLREKHGRGGTEIGVARARDIKNRKNLSPETVRRMNSYFARHEVDKQGEGWGEDSAGYIAWLLWGGDAGRAWAKRKAEQMDKGENQRSDTYKEIAQRLGSAAKNDRPGAKAEMGRWEATQTKKHGKPITEHTATINGVAYMIEKPDAMGTSATLYVWNDNRGMERIATGDVDALKARAEGMRKKEARGVAAIERLANYSRPGAKARMGMRDTKGRGPFTLQYIASGLYGEPTWLLVDKAGKTVAKEHNEQSAQEMLRKANAGEPVYVSSRPGAKARMGRDEQIAAAERLLHEAKSLMTSNAWGKASTKIMDLQDVLRGMANRGDRNITTDAKARELLSEAAAMLKQMATGRKFSRPGAKARMGRDVKVQRGTSRDAVAIVGRNGGGDGGYYAGLILRHKDGEEQVLWMKHGYLTEKAAERAAVQRLDSHVSRMSRPGAKARFSADDVRTLLRNAESMIWTAKRPEQKREVVELVKDAERMMDDSMPPGFRTRLNALKQKIASEFSRPGAKATFAADAREVGNEILRQLGGGRFMSMVGGKNAMYGMFGGKPGLQVTIGKGAEGGINRVIITLDPATDTYRMEFWKIAKGGMSTQRVSEASMVYADDLQRVFTDRTKFYTSMSRPGAKVANAVREGEKVSASDTAVSRKIRKLMDEGKPQKQAVAIALDLERRGEL